MGIQRPCKDSTASLHTRSAHIFCRASPHLGSFTFFHCWLLPSLGPGSSLPSTCVGGDTGCLWGQPLCSTGLQVVAWWREFSARGLQISAPSRMRDGLGMTCFTVRL